MKVFVALVCVFVTAVTSPLKGASNTFIDYQNFNHGYCSECNCYPCRCDPAPNPPCTDCNGDAPPPPPDPAAPPPPPPVVPPPKKPCTPPDTCNPAPVCATECGISLWWIGIGIAVIAAAASILITNNNGKTPHRSP